METPLRIAVTGATGYIGGRLVPELLEANHRVRCLARTPEKLEGLPWAPDVKIVKGGLGDPDALAELLADVDVAYYLVHSMTDASSGFSDRDRKFAATFRDVAGTAGVGRIVYLGGLGDENDADLSAHLRSRQEVGRILSSGPTPVIELRAAVIIGSGSASFEMLRSIAEVLPVMITPRWVRTRCQPIAIRDVLFYLQTAATLEAAGQVIEVGGPDVVTYQAMMNVYAQQAGLRRRRILPVPVLSPKLSSHWIGLVTSLPTSLAKPLVHGLANEVIVRDDTASVLMPHRCMSFVEAIDAAIARMRDLEVTTSWAGADLAWRSPADPVPTDPEWSGGTVLQDVRTVTTEAPAAAVYKTVSGIGGDRGWFVTDRLWQLRGLIDELMGGVGMRRGRRHPDELRVGDALDFWRVESLVHNRLLRLRAEMRLPGKAWLEWTISEKNGTTTLKQWARFQPRGVPGRLYWYSLHPFHGIIFKGLANAIIKRSNP